MAGPRQWSGPVLRNNGARRRIGLLGGSFNPAHGGHRRVSLSALAALQLDAVWWLVSPGNPLKPKAGMAPLAARLASARRQTRRSPIIPTAIEAAMGTRYTHEALDALRRRYRKVTFVWLMGSDNLAQFHCWRRWRTIANSVRIAVIERPGYRVGGQHGPGAQWLRRWRVPPDLLFDTAAPAVAYLRLEPDDRSATAIRRDDPDWANDFANVPVRDTLTHRLIGGRDLS